MYEVGWVSEEESKTVLLFNSTFGLCHCRQPVQQSSQTDEPTQSFGAEEQVSTPEINCEAFWLNEHFMTPEVR